jgi:hypothetical protein
MVKVSTCTERKRGIRRGLNYLSFAGQHKAAVQQISALKTALDEFFFPEQIDEPKPPTLGFYASDVFHDFLLFIPRIHICGAQAHGFLLMHILPQLRQEIRLGVRSLLSVVSGKRVCDGFLSLHEVRYVLESYSLKTIKLEQINSSSVSILRSIRVSDICNKT